MVEALVDGVLILTDKTLKRSMILLQIGLLRGTTRSQTAIRKMAETTRRPLPRLRNHGFLNRGILNRSPNRSLLR